MENLEESINKKRSHEKSVSLGEYINELMGKHGYETATELYTNAGISKQAFYKILSDTKYRPSLETMIRLALALKLDSHECKYLLKKASYTLASSSKFSLIIRYCIENEIYEIDKVNEILEKEGFEKI